MLSVTGATLDSTASVKMGDFTSSSYPSTFTGKMGLLFATLPLASGGAGSFTVSYKDGSNVLYSESVLANPFSVTAGSLSNIKITPDSTTASTATDYLFELDLVQGAANDFQIVITFPAEFTLTAGACTLTTLTAIDHATPACNIAGQVATLSSLFNAAQSAGTSVAFKITSNVITNPASTTSANSITIETKTSGGVLAASATIPNLFPFTELMSATITKDSNVAYATATYTFALTSGIVYTANSNIVFTINLPAEVTVPDTTAATAACALTGDLTGGTCAVTSSTISVTKDFGATPPIAGTTYTFSVGGLRN